MELLKSSAPRVPPFTACNRKGGCFTLSNSRKPSHRHVIRAAFLSNHEEKTALSTLGKAYRLTLAGVLASGFLWLSPSPAEAEMQVVPPQMVTQMARPLPKQTVDKGKIWSVFIGGAVLLFGITVVAENNETFFPAISRANKAFRMATKQIAEMEERQKKEDELLRLRQAQYDEEQRQLALVQQGMREARTRVVGSGDGSAPHQPVQVASVAPPAQVPAAAAEAPTASSLEPHSESTPSPSTNASASSASYVVVEDAIPDMGAMAWPAGAAAVPAVASTRAHAEETPAQAAHGTGARTAAAAAAAVAEEEEDDAEAMARRARLQGFVSGTMSSGVSPLEAYKAQRQ